MGANRYSQLWQATFGVDRDPARTERECEFLSRVLPLPGYRRVIDAACGQGRHARGLASRGYRVVGLDRNPAAIAAAWAAGGGPRYLVADMSSLPLETETFDALISMWASFGYGDHAANTRQLERMALSVRPGGRLVLDLYHPGFFTADAAYHVIDTGGQKVGETRMVADGRLRVRLEFASGEADDFDWQLYTPDELVEMAALCGCGPVLSCRDWHETASADATAARFQIVLERASAD